MKEWKNVLRGVGKERILGQRRSKVDTIFEAGLVAGIFGTEE